MSTNAATEARGSRHAGLVGAALAAALLAACGHDGASALNPIHLVVPSYSDDDLRDIGLQADRALQEHLDIIHDPVVVGFLNELGQRLVEIIEPQPFLYRFRVIRANSLNAFAIPGGFIYLHSETVLRASSVDELAGVLAHEIAHIEARHFSRRQARTAIPKLVARAAAVGASIATEEPGLMAVGEGVNVALEIAFTREYEAEADDLATRWLAETGHRPDRLAHFLDRIVRSQDQFPDHLPDYLRTHPDPEDRIAAIRAAAERLELRDEADVDLEAALPRVQDRLATLVATRRSALPEPVVPADPEQTRRLLAEADRRISSGDVEGALFALAQGEHDEGADPRIPFRVGEILFEQGRYAEAAASFQRTATLDPSRAQVFYQLGRAAARAGSPQEALFAFDQAEARAPRGSRLRERIQWEIEKLSFEAFEASGFADGAAEGGTPAGAAETGFAAGARVLAWWGRVGGHYVDSIDQLDARWIDPEGRPMAGADTQTRRRTLTSRLTVPDPGARPGPWTLEISLAGDPWIQHVVEVRERKVAPGPGADQRSSSR